MVGVVSDAGLGLFGSSLSSLGAAGAAGNPSIGRGNDRAYVNTATGNLILQSRDEQLASIGMPLGVVRTYNSQGLLDDDNHDNWRLGIHQRLYGLTGTLNASGSSIHKVFGDGHDVLYSYDTARAAYVSADGDGAHDTLTHTGGTWTWTDGTARNTETYDSTLRISSSRGVDGNGWTCTYTGALLTSLQDDLGQQTFLDYSGNNLTQIRVVSDSVTQTLTRYEYDSSNRLWKVRVDLSPDDNSVADNDVYTTTYTYDGTSHRVTSIAQSDGTSVAITYESDGNGGFRVHTFTDGEGRVTEFEYTNGSGGGGAPIDAPANAGVLSTTDTQNVTNNYSLNTGAVSTTDQQTVTNTYNLNPGALTTPSSGSWSTPALLESAAGTASQPQLAFNANGNGVAAWVQGGTLYGRSYTKSTDTWSSAVEIETGVGSFSLRKDADDTVYVTYQLTGPTTLAIRARAYDFSSESWWLSLDRLIEDTGEGGGPPQETISAAQFRAATSASGFAWIAASSGQAYLDWYPMLGLPEIRVLGSSQVTALSMEFDPDNTIELGGGGGIAAYPNSVLAIYEEAGSVIAFRFDGRNYSDTTTTLGSGSGHHVVMDAHGNALVTWIDGNDLKARRYDKAADTWQAAVTLDSSAGAISTSEVSIDSAGNVVAAWVQSDGTAASLYTQRFSAASGTWGTATLLETSANAVDGAADSISISVAGSKVAIAWLQTDGTRNDLYVARFDGTVWSTGAIVDTSNDPAFAPSVAIDSQGAATVVWQQLASSNPSIYSARFTPGSGGASYYLVPAGASWQSVANTLYGVNSAAAGAALQSALGNPSLTEGSQLTNLPSTLSVTTTQTITVPAYFTIPSGATWQSVANTLYGINSAAAGSALQTALGNPALTVGNRLTNLPATLSVTTTQTITVPAYYTVSASDTWASITQAIYGTTDANAIAALQAALSNPTLSTGLKLTVPLTLSYVPVGASGSTLYLNTDVKDPLGRITTYVRDTNGRLTQIQSPTVNGTRLETRYTYDSDGNVLTVAGDPAGANRVAAFAYDANGNLLVSRDADGNTVRYTYDNANQLRNETHYVVRDPDGAGGGQASQPLTARSAYDAQRLRRGSASALHCRCGGPRRRASLQRCGAADHDADLRRRAL